MRILFYLCVLPWVACFLVEYVPWYLSIPVVFFSAWKFLLKLEKEGF